MKIQQTCTAAALGLLLSLASTSVSHAQEVERSQTNLSSFNYVEVQGGAGATLVKHADFNKLIKPVASLSVGHYFSPYVGMRLHVSGLESKSGFNNLNGGTYYDWKYITGDLDVLFNLTNYFNKAHNQWLNLLLVAGVGVNNAWDNDEANNVAKLVAESENIGPHAMCNVWDGSRLSHNLRAGLRLETNMAKRVGVSLEVVTNNLNDSFNSRHKNNSHGMIDDWMITAQLGVSFRFGQKFSVAPSPLPVQLVQNVDNSRNIGQDLSSIAAHKDTEAEKKPVAEKTPVSEKTPVAETKASQKIEVFFNLNSAELSTEAKANVEKIANWLKIHPQSKVDITGYADKGTGTAAINRRISELRVKTVANELVKKYGIEPSRIRTDFK